MAGGKRPGAMDRREFARRAAAGASGAAGALWAGEYARALGANDRLELAVVGTGQQGRALIEEALGDGRGLGVRIRYLCDIWKLAREKAQAQVRGLQGEEPEALKSTDDLYARKGFDAVVIATPDHQHARMGAEAAKQGKDAYIEMPLAHFLDDALEALKAVRASGRLVQMGARRRSSPRHQAAAEFARSGKLGEVTSVELRWNASGSKRWRRQEEVASLREQDTDWKRFLLHLPSERFDPRKHLEFRLFWPYSGGIAGQWLSHLIDIVPWFTGDPFPRSCVASGGLYSLRDGRGNPDTFAAVFEYPRGFQVGFRSRLNNSEGGVGAVFHSSRGRLDAEAGLATGEGGGDPDDPAAARLEEPVRFPEAGGVSHLRNFLECVRSRKTPNADIDSGFLHSVALCMAIEAYHTGKRIGYDPGKEKLAGA